MKFAWLQSRIFHIRGRDGSAYLSRYRIVHSRWFRVFLHHFHRSDEDTCCHDHQWAFLSIVLAGGYREHTPRGSSWCAPGSVLVRPATWLHRIEISKPAWSLVFAGPRVRDWGFLTPSGWCFWKTYMAGGCGGDS